MNRTRCENALIDINFISPLVQQVQTSLTGLTLLIFTEINNLIYSSKTFILDYVNIMFHPVSPLTM